MIRIPHHIIPVGLLDHHRLRAVREDGEAMYFKSLASFEESAAAKHVTQAITSSAHRDSALWAELHAYCLAHAGDVAAAEAWLTGWIERVQCGACREDGQSWIAANSPPWHEPTIVFAWSVDFHNYVNTKLARPIWSLGQATDHWRGATLAPPAE